MKSHRPAVYGLVKSSLLILLTAFVAACQDRGPMGALDLTSPVDSVTPRFDITTVEPLVVGAPDSFFLQEAKNVPGFAGYYISDGRLKVRSKTRQVSPTLRLPSNPNSTVWPTDAEAADWSFVELARWNRPFRKVVTQFRWQTLDIDEKLNRLTAHVADIASVQAALTKAGVPANVYLLTDTNSPLTDGDAVAAASPSPLPLSPSLAAMACTSIRSACNPIWGGLEVHNVQANKLGTLSFNVDHWSYGDSFLTVTHIEPAAMGVATGSTIRQPQNGNAIGTEVYDRPFISSSDMPAGVCPDNHSCRWADVAVYQYNSGIANDLGRVAKVTATRSFSVSGSWPVTHERSPIQGETLKLLGRTSGLRSGTVEATCVDYNWPGADNTTLLCQYRHSYGLDGGDSGGPLYRQGNTVIEIAGIAHSQGDGIFEDDTWFSPMSGIRKDINPNTDLTCDGLEFELGGGCATSGGGGGTGGGELQNRVPSIPRPSKGAASREGR